MDGKDSEGLPLPGETIGCWWVLGKKLYTFWALKDSSATTVLQVALLKLSGSQNKTKDTKVEKGFVGKRQNGQ